MKSLVVGYGSIGKRHVRILQEKGQDIYIVSRHLQDCNICFKTIEEALSQEYFDYIIVANETSEHIETLNLINKSNFSGIILIEKPIFSKSENVMIPKNLTYVAYNLRFHPLIQDVREMLLNEDILSVNAYAGQYLPTWRPRTDYSKGYSAQSALGGGVVRDLSHELDYLTYLFGEWKELVATWDRISDLKIQSEDYCQVIYRTRNNVNVTLELNYLDRIIQRYFTVQTNRKTIKVDLISNNININGKIIQYPELERDYTYIKQHENILAGSSITCTFEDGMSIIRMIEAIERSSTERKWIKHE